MDLRLICYCKYLVYFGMLHATTMFYKILHSTLVLARERDECLNVTHRTCRAFLVCAASSSSLYANRYECEMIGMIAAAGGGENLLIREITLRIEADEQLIY